MAMDYRNFYEHTALQAMHLSSNKIRDGFIQKDKLKVVAVDNLYNVLRICVHLFPACGLTTFLVFSRHLPHGLTRRSTDGLLCGLLLK